MRCRHALTMAVLPVVTAMALCACSGPAAEPSGPTGGAQATVTFEGTSQLKADTLRRTADRLRRRATAQGLTGVRVEMRDDSVVVTGPASSTDRLRELGSTGRLRFRPVVATEVPGQPQPSSSPHPEQGRPVTDGVRLRTAESASASASAYPSASASAAPTTGSPGQPDAALQQKYAALDCAKPEQRAGASGDDRPQDLIVACGADGNTSGRNTKYLLGPTALDGSDVASAKAVYDSQAGGWRVRLDFDAKGARALAALTGQLARQVAPQNEFAIVLDGAVVSAPYVSQSLTGGRADISGSFDKQEAERLATILESGALPVPLKVTEVSTRSSG